MTLVRVAHGQPPPAEPELRAALERDRARLHLPPEKCHRDFSVAGPYPISIEGEEFDEYVVWER